MEIPPYAAHFTRIEYAKAAAAPENGDETGLWSNIIKYAW